MPLVQPTRPDAKKPLHKPEDLGMVRSWSFSALKTFEACPYRTYISKVKRIPEPSGPAADRGSKIHDLAENYVNGNIEKLPAELNKFENEFVELRKLHEAGQVELEGEWGFTIDWEPTHWLNDFCWLRVKLDALVKENETSARVIDYKTGKRYGNELTHSQQCLLYAIASFMRHPELEYVKTELWYLDQEETATFNYTREEAMEFLPGFHTRGIAMTTCVDFDPKPHKETCRWCSYKKGEFPECRWGVL